MLSASVAGVAAVFDCVCIVVIQRSASVAGVAAVFYDCDILSWGKALKKLKKNQLKKK